MRDFFDNLGLHSKLFLIFGLSTILISAIIIAGMIQMHWVKRVYLNEHLAILSQIQSIYTIRVELGKARSAVEEILNEKNTLSASHLESINLASKKINTQFMLLLLNKKQERSSFLKQVENLQMAWIIFAQTRDNDILPSLLSRQSHRAVSLAMGPQKERYQALITLTNNLLGQAIVEAKGTQNALDLAINKTIKVYAVIAISAFICLIILVFLFASSLQARIRSILVTIKRFQNGDRPELPDPKSKKQDEIGNIEFLIKQVFAQIFEFRIEQEQFLILLKAEMAENEAKKSELQRSEAKYKGLVETTYDWVWEIDEDGLYRYSSPRSETLLGYAPEEVVGRRLVDFVDKDEAQKVEEFLRQIFGNRSPIINLEVKCLHKTGSSVFLETSAMPFYDHEGRFQGYRGIDRDITARKMASAEIHSLQEQLIHSEKLAAIGQLAAGVAHEINTPLGYLRSNCNVLIEHIDETSKLIALYREFVDANRKKEGEATLNLLERLDEFDKKNNIDYLVGEQLQILKESRDGLDRIKSIVAGLKEFAHTGAEKMELYDINDCIHDAVRLSWHEIKNVVELEKDLHELPKILCRPQQITQIFVNLIVNAVQAMEKGHIWIKSSLQDGCVIVSVRDDGAGMSEVVKKQVFDPFFTTKPVGKGTGLGLSIVHGIISRHKGNISLESALPSVPI